MLVIFSCTQSLPPTPAATSIIARATNNKRILRISKGAVVVEGKVETHSGGSASAGGSASGAVRESRCISKLGSLELSPIEHDDVHVAGPTVRNTSKHKIVPTYTSAKIMPPASDLTCVNGHPLKDCRNLDEGARARAPRVCSRSGLLIDEKEEGFLFCEICNYALGAFSQHDMHNIESPPATG